MDLTSENIYNYQEETLYAIKFLNDFNIVPIYVEKRINWTYSGKPDIVGTIEDKFIIIDWKPYRDWETDRKSTRLNSSHSAKSRMPSSA